MSLLNEKSRNPDRIRPMLERLEEAWNLYPDMRLGQLIAVCAGRDSVCGIEDDKMLERIQDYIDKMKNAGL